ncbi:HNH endonuclease [Mycobacterium sp. CnD-18-1]|uniref:HNH endonuclease n=1 Tax=Mycobacterium sp. CnD-18-1 TaxID=2917744 RepID=UPI0035B3BA08
MRARSSGKRSILRVAIEDGDYATILSEAAQRAEVDGNGCWIWPQIKGGYPIHRPTGAAMHRVVLEARHGAPLGSQAAHHICANTKCVNPDHLQPVTHRENTAEMLARHAYLNRISELESALREMTPHHPLLQVVAYI